VDTDAAIVELYGLEPERFVAARNQLAKQLRDHDERAAAAVMALRKPTIAAWLANQLVRVAPDQIHALTELGEQLRETYLTTDTARRRELTRRRHDLVRDLVTTARHQAAGGRRLTEQTAERLSETLDAALVDPAAAQLLRTGQLTSALRHVGFGVVDENGDPAALVPVRPRVVRRGQPATKTPTKPTTKAPAAGRAEKTAPQPAKATPPPVDRTLELRAAQQRRLEQAEADYAAAAADRDEAERALDSHQHRVHDLEADLIRLNEQLEQTRQNLREARKQLPRLQRRFNLADRNATAIQKRRDTEQQRLQALDPPNIGERPPRNRRAPR
jgi:superfamily II RNA helicase